MRRRKNINLGITSWSITKLSELTLKEFYGWQNYKFDLGVKGLVNDLAVLLWGEITGWSFVRFKGLTPLICKLKLFQKKRDQVYLWALPLVIFGKFNLFTSKMSWISLLIACHRVCMMLTWRIWYWINWKTPNLCFSLFSLLVCLISCWYC